MPDAFQQTPIVGDQRIAARTLRHATSDPLLLVGADGSVRKQPVAETLLLGDLAAAARQGRLAGVQTHTFETLLTGWTAYLAGTGSRYIQNPANQDALHDPEALTAVALAQGAGTSGSNAATQARNNTHLFAGSGTSWVCHASAKNLDRIGVLRIGYIGNNSAPTAAGRPSNGIWIEFDRSVDTAEWSLVVADNGTYNSDLCGPTVAENPDWSWFQFRMNSDTEVALYEVSSAAAPTELSVISSGLPSTDARRSGRLFAQLVADDPASGAFSILFLDSLFPLPAQSRTPVLQA